MDTIKKEKYSFQKNYFNLANNNFKNCDFGDIQSFMAHDIFTLNIFDEEVKKEILSKTNEKLSNVKLNKLVILLKYFLRTGISIYHFKNNEFTKKFVYSDNRTINRCLEILEKANLIKWSMYKNPNNPKLSGYSINPQNALKFAISLKENNSFTRNTKQQKKALEILESSYDEEEKFYESVIEDFLRNNEKEEDSFTENEEKQIICLKNAPQKKSDIPTDEEMEELLKCI